LLEVNQCPLLFADPTLHDWAVNPLDLIWIFFILSSLQPVVQRQMLAQSRRRGL